jgi:adenylate kinase family enzyme
MRRSRPRQRRAGSRRCSAAGHSPDGAGPGDRGLRPGGYCGAARAAPANNDLVRRISVVGISGAGKTTLARQLAAALGIPHLELDSVFHQRGWQPLPLEDFRARVAEFAVGDAWVIDGNYSRVQDLVWARADTVVWLDPPRWRVMTQLVPRTLGRMVRRTELWNGNRESWTGLFRADPEQSILGWAWTRHGPTRERYRRARADPANARLRFIHLTTPEQVAAFLRAAGSDPGRDNPGPGHQESRRAGW